MGTAIRILLVEDFEPFRTFTKSLLQDKPDFQIVCEASDGLQAVLRAKELDPDLILMDIGLPGLNGIEAARQIRAVVPKARIVFLTQENSAEIVQAALSLGALGYVHKPCAGNDLLQAIEAALQGRQFVSHHPNGFPLTEGSDRPATE
jgi:DNA-binding NarL/FixJ family response regulator